MKKDMNAVPTLRARQARTNLLLRHCLSLGTAEHRVPARRRLEDAIGPDLARRLIHSLTSRGRR